MSISRRRYALEFKQEAVQLVTKEGLSLSEAGRRLGGPANLVRTWKQSFEKKEHKDRHYLSSAQRFRFGRSRVSGQQYGA